jgi:hypothetical protein
VRQSQSEWLPLAVAQAAGEPAEPSTSALANMNLHVGVLQWNPSCEPFPLLSHPTLYAPDTIDLQANVDDRVYWLSVLQSQIPTVIQKAIATHNGTPFFLLGADFVSLVVSRC